MFAREAVLRPCRRAPGELPTHVPALLLQPSRAEVLAELFDLFVIRDVLHREVRRPGGGAAVRHALDLDEVGLAEVDELRVLAGVRRVHALDERGGTRCAGSCRGGR